LCANCWRKKMASLSNLSELARNFGRKASDLTTVTRDTADAVKAVLKSKDNDDVIRLHSLWLKGRNILKFAAKDIDDFLNWLDTDATELMKSREHVATKYEFQSAIDKVEAIAKQTYMTEGIMRDVVKSAEDLVDGKGKPQLVVQAMRSLTRRTQEYVLRTKQLNKLIVSTANSIVKAHMED